MDSTDLKLYQEEQRAILKNLSTTVSDFLSAVKEKRDHVVVSGEVGVNTEKTVDIGNIKEFIDALDVTAEVIATAVKENSYKPEPLTISNIQDAKADSVSISNLPEFKKYFENVVAAIKANQPIVKIAKQEVVFPTSAKEPIAVRLSDGKEFYKAMMSVVGGGGGGIQQALTRENGTTLAVTNPDGSNIGGATVWGLNDTEDTGTYKYFGFSASNGSWKLTRKTIATNAWRYATGASDYTTAWTDRASHTYAIYDEVF